MNGYSRVPVSGEGIDDIVGIAYAKDLMRAERDGQADRAVGDIVRPAHFVPESKRVAELLREMQSRRNHLAVVVDEYGGTAGLVTLEDLIEEIVGEIRDEYDVEAEPVVDEGHGVFVVSGKADVSVLEEQFGVDIDRAGFDSVGGYLLATLGRVPTKGEHVVIGGLAVEVLEAERRRVTRVRVRKVAPADAEADPQKRQAGLSGAERQIIEDAPMVWIAQPNYNLAVRDNVEGVSQQNDEALRFWTMSKK